MVESVNIQVQRNIGKTILELDPHDLHFEEKSFSFCISTTRYRFIIEIINVKSTLIWKDRNDIFCHLDQCQCICNSSKNEIMQGVEKEIVNFQC